MKKKKRLFAILLAFCVTLTMMPLAGSGGGGACCEFIYIDLAKHLCRG